MIDKVEFLKLLRSYNPLGSAERDFQSLLTKFVENEPSPFSRATRHGHVTASSWIVDNLQENVLLIFHDILNEWLQPGGHIELTDLSIEDAARREAIEETHLGNDAFLGMETSIFDIDVHRIPENQETAEHLHYDVRFRYRLFADSSSFPVIALQNVRWIRISELASISNNDGLLRMASKSALGKIPNKYDNRLEEICP